MIKEKTIRVCDRKVVIKELTVFEIEKLYSTEEGIKAIIATLNDDHEFIPLMLTYCSNLSIEEIRSMGLPEYKLAIDAMREVNKSFFEIWGMELKNLLAKGKVKNESQSGKEHAG